MGLQCVIMQPTFLPWLGYFDLIDQADVFVFYNDVQFTKRSWQCRNRILTSSGIQFISASVVKSPQQTEISEIKLSYDEPWIEKQLKTLEYNYKKSNYFDSVFSFVSEFFLRKPSYLQDFNIDFIRSVATKLGIQTSFKLSSELEKTGSVKDHRLLEICRQLDCNTYISPLGSSVYIEEHNAQGAFLNSGVHLVYQNYVPAFYTQRSSDFIPYLSILDLLFNVGFEDSLEIIRNGRKPFLVSKDLSTHS